MIIQAGNTASIQRIVDRLRAGELIGMPTETVYGLAGDASNLQAVEKIFTLKKRPKNNPLIVHVANQAKVHDWVSNFPLFAQMLAEAFWPGSLTLVLPKAVHVSDLLTAAQSSVALRVPAHPVALNILEEFGGGLAAPSANLFTEVSPTQAAHVAEAFPEDLWVIEGGNSTVGLESTIIDCTQKIPTILRAGMITPEDIFLKTGLQINLVTDSSVLHPGQHLVHYAPKKKLRLFTSEALQEEIAKGLPKDAGLLLCQLSPKFFEERQVEYLGADADQYAHRLYAALHKLDKAPCHEIWVELPPTGQRWEAIHARLSKASFSVHDKS